MPDITQGEALPNIDTSKTTSTSGPDWYNDYLQSLAKPGQDLLGKTGDQLVAGFDPLQQNVLSKAQTALGSYSPTMDAAASTASQAAKGITPENIASFMNPYTSGVINETERLSAQNMSRNLIPGLKAAFVGTGAPGSQRMAGALGQMGADVQGALSGQQGKMLTDQYNTAVNFAKAQSDLQRQGAETQRGIATSDLDAAVKELQTQYGFGKEAQNLEQQKILAPLSAATTAGNVFANLKVPSTVSEKASAPIPGAYATPLLSQLTGLGTLFSSPTGGQSPIGGLTEFLFGNGKTGDGATRGLIGAISKLWDPP